MKRYLLLLLTAILALSANAKEADEPDDKCVIESFVFVATIDESNTWSVTEKIKANFLAPRHGIYQYIENRYNDLLDGELYKYSIEVTDISVPIFKSETKLEEGFQVIRIGDPNGEIMGEMEYTINYKLHFNDDRYAKADILYATILGAQWRNEIKDFQFGLAFKKKLPADFEKKFKIMSGKLGEKGNALNVAYDIDWEANRIYGRVQNIGHHNAITLRAELPQGFWRVKQGDIVSANKNAQLLFYAAIVLFVVAVVYLYMNRRRKPVMVIEYKAPDDINSAAVGYIMDEVADASDLSSLIVWWASKGYLRIEEKEVEEGIVKRKKKQIILHAIQDLPHDIQGYQRTFWKALFKGDKTECNLSEDLRDRGTYVKQAIGELGRVFTGSRKLVNFNKTGMLLIALYFIVGGLAIMLSSKVAFFDHEYLVALVAWVIMTFGFGFLHYKNADKGLKGYLREKKGQGIMLLLSMAFLCFYTINTVVPLDEPQNNALPKFAMEGIILGGWIMVLLVGSLRMDTEYRKEKLSHLLGFREFIKTAEVPMLKAMVDENPEYFYEVLPFAMVFGLTDKWYEHFANIPVSDPDWYTSDSADSLSSRSSISTGLGVGLSNSLGNLISTGLLASSINLAISTTTGGGGHSGGGGGGGGGGSW
ncbi:MAG: DUF2207 domain-containing protein [Bacteroidaceae bacterium]|nr:DUF2207 domain-containing protein [Bacteroidaceae bacterium]